MVKRIATPPPADDTEYLTVVSPYPLNPNWELPADQVAFARWIACVLGSPDSFYSFYWKPKALGMVIVEIDKEYGDLTKVLGEHRWSEFLQSPIDEEEERKSQIFFCLYKTDREAQKDGWKRLPVQEEWFAPDKWNVKNRVIKYPYPSTHWCATPTGDQVNKKDLCRPLPVQHPTEPAKKAPPPHLSARGGKSASSTTRPDRVVPGSSGWTSAQKEAVPPPRQQKQQAARAAWGRGRGTAPPGRGTPPTTTTTRGGGPPPRTHPWGAQHPTSTNVVPLPTDSNVSTGSLVPPDLISSTASGSSSIQTLSTPFEEKVGGRIKSTIPIVGEYDDESDDDGEGGTELPSHSPYAPPPNAPPVYVPEKKKEEEEICPAHGIICRKGICEVMSKLKSEKKHAAEREKREQAKAERMSQMEEKQSKRRGGKGKGKMPWRKNDSPAAAATKTTTSSTSSPSVGRSSATSARSSPPPSPSVRDDDTDDASDQDKVESATTSSKPSNQKVNKPWDEYDSDDEW